MKKTVIVLIAIAALFTALFATGEPASAAATNVGPFEGKFNGTVYGPGGQKAPLSLNLTHRGTVVEGTAFIGEGLTVDAGICGSGAVPAGAVYASGRTSASNPRLLQATTTFDVEGVPVTVNLTGTITGKTIDAKTKIDLPWFCGGDPLLTGKLIMAG